MSALSIRIHKYLDSDPKRAPHVPARIYPMAHKGKSERAPIVRTMIPISGDPKVAATVTLAEGTYYVETVLPSGEVLADTVELDGPTGSLTLHAQESPHEWFSWQQLSGNLKPAVPEVPAIGALSIKARKLSTPRTPPGAVRRKNVVRSPAAIAEESVSIGRPIHILSTPLAALVGGAHGPGDTWELLADAESADALALIQRLNSGKSPFHLQAYTSDAARAVYRLSVNRSNEGGVQALSPHVAQHPRYFAVVPRRSRLELLSLPIPWRIVGTGREAAVEIATQQVHLADEFCSSLIARDEKLGMLLAFLSSGAMPAVREMAETAKELLFYKFENPYAAAAGGYAMVGTAQQIKDVEWHGWIRRLMTSFEAIPDGAIQWAQLRLRIRKHRSDMDEAAKALKLAYRRGIPFYSLGIKWLLEGLEWISDNDAEAKDMLRNVRRISWLTNFQQPFTILRVGGKRNV